MKRICLITLAFIATLGAVMASCSDHEPEKPGQEEQPTIPDSNTEDDSDDTDNGSDDTPENNDKILVVYYSHSGNTQTIAEYIHDAVGGDIVKIETVNTYPINYDEHLEQARKEVAEGYLPPLKTSIENMSDYDVVFVGYPIWVETAAPPIASFLASYSFKGKTVVPFCTSGTSSAAASYRLVSSYCSESNVLDGIQIRRGTYDTAHERVIAWLQNIGFIKSNNGK